MTIIPRIIPIGTIMKKLAIIKKPMIAVHGKGGGRAAPTWLTRSPRRVRAATNTGGFAADLLQVQSAEKIHSIYDCRLAKPFGATRSRRRLSSPLAKSSTAKRGGAFGQAPLGGNPAPQPRSGRGGLTQDGAGGDADHGCHHNAYRF